MSFPRYPKYKDSGVEWLGAVPEHWEVKRLGSIFRQLNESGEDHLAILCVSIHDGVSDKELGEEEMDRKVTRSDDRSKYKKVEPGDLVYNMMRAWQGGFGAVAVQGMVSPAYVVARPISAFSTAFIEHLLRTPQAIEQMRRYSQGVTDFRLRLYWEEFKTISIVLPPSDEQVAIIEFLEQEISKIDELVAEQQRLIELLKEKRQAVISHAVTKGLNPHAPMKPSGIEWLGDVPAHWRYSRLKRLVDVRGRIGFRGYTTEDLVEEGDGALALGGTNLTSSGRLDLSKRTYLSWSKYDESPEIKVAVNDLVIGQRGTCGKVVIIEQDIGPATINPSLVLLKRPIIESRFLCFWLMGSLIQSRFDSYLNATAVPMLSQEQIGNVPVCHPPTAEQREIVAFLNAETTSLDTLTAEAQRAIDLLQERRAALISAAVTGQIDVRQFAENEIAA